MIHYKRCFCVELKILNYISGSTINPGGILIISSYFFFENIINYTVQSLKTHSHRMLLSLGGSDQHLHVYSAKYVSRMILGKIFLK